MTNDTDERTTEPNDDDPATGGRSPCGDEGEAESTGDGPTDPARIGAMDRRDYLRAVSAAAAVADSPIETSVSTVRIDAADAGIDLASPGECRLNFWEGSPGESSISIEAIRLE